jgi:hypothetical protein
MVDPHLRDRTVGDPRDVVDRDERTIMLVAEREERAVDVQRLGRALMRR